MSDSKKPKLSEIKARVGEVAADPLSNVGYLLDLVDRMGKALEGKLWCCNHVLKYDANCKFCKEARALLEEIKK